MNEERIREDLALAYDRNVDQRDGQDVSGWKQRERSGLLKILRDEGKSSLVDIGSGPGTHASYFKNQGIEVTCIDISPGNVERCIEKGLGAYRVDVLNLKSLGMTFDSAFAMNSLLHVPRSQLTQALSAIRDSLNPAGVFYWGQYSGDNWEGVREEDDYEPKRFFSWLDDDQITIEAARVFAVEEFSPVSLEGGESFHFQSLILRVKNSLDGEG